MSIFYRVTLMSVGVMTAMAVVAWLPPAHADEMERIGKEGSRFGHGLRRKQEYLGTPTVDESGNTITLTDPAGTQLDINDLMPGQNPDEVNRLKELYDQDPAAMQEAAGRKRTVMETEQSAAGSAYRTVRENDSKPPVDVSRENVWAVAGSVIRQETIDGLEDAFPDCTRTRTMQQFGSKEVVAHQNKACQRLQTPPTCMHERNVHAVPTTGEYVSDESIQADVSYEIDVRDYLNGFVGGHVSASVTWTGDVEDVRLTEMPDATNAYHATIALRYKTTTCDPAASPTPCEAQSAHLVVSLEASIVQGGDVASSPPECLEGNDGFCAAQWTCLDSAPRLVNGAWIDETSAPLLPRLYEGEPESQLCWLARADYTCNYAVGEICGAGAGSGGQMCEAVTADSVAPSSCDVLETDPKCAKVKTSCASNAIGPGGFCYVETDTYDCRRTVNAPVYSEKSTFACDTPIRCMGTECLVDEGTGSEGASADRLDKQDQLALVQQALADFDPTCDRAPCRLFPGEFLRCHRATGGSLSFCSVDNDDSAKSLYLDWFSKQLTRAAAIRLEEQDDGGEHGAWASLQDSSNWNASVVLGSALTSEKETARSNGESARREPNPNPTTIDDYSDMLGQEPSLSNLPRVYGRYLRELELSTSNWEGNAEEYDLFRKRGLSQCIHVGDYCEGSGNNACPSVVESYCCFSTALGKAVHEHLGTTFGDPRNPTCAAGTSTPFQQLAQDATFRSTEWTAMQTFAGVTPNVGNADQLGSESTLTGDGNAARLSDQTRDTLSARTDRYMSGIQGEAIKRTVAAEIRANALPAVADPVGPGTVSFSPAVYFGGETKTLSVSVARDGKAGAVSANFRVSARPGVSIVVSPKQGVVSWTAGESGSKRITFTVDREGLSTEEIKNDVILFSTQGGLRLGVSPSAKLFLKKREP